MGKAKPVYQDACEFFSLTYPTFNLRELAKDVVLRLAEKSDVVGVVNYDDSYCCLSPQDIQYISRA
jgi:predicted AAA+ superfamily ATPase